MSKSIKAFLFDCDGTLFDTEPVKGESWGRAVTSLLRSSGVSPPDGIVHQVAAMYQPGGTTDEVARDMVIQCKKTFPGLLDFLSIEVLKPERAKAKDTLFDEVFPPLGSKRKSSRNLLIRPIWNLAVEVKKQGYTVALVTVSTAEMVKRYFNANAPMNEKNEPVLDPEEFFDVVICGQKKGEGIREAVGRILSISDFSKIPRKEMSNFVIIEDSPEGIREAKSVGVQVIAVPNKFTEYAFPDLLLSQRKIAGLAVADLIRLLDER
jgi:beta-phosphoglucomutase-like phosphatase (HAD superfamily)